MGDILPLVPRSEGRSVDPDLNNLTGISDDGMMEVLSAALATVDLPPLLLVVRERVQAAVEAAPDHPAEVIELRRQQ